MLHSLKVQISLAIAVLILLFASATLYSLHTIERQRSDDALVQLAGRLQFHQQHLAVQAMRYHENAPRDYPSYYRDLRLYFEDLKKTRAELTRTIDAFASNDFSDHVMADAMAMAPRLPADSHAVAVELQTAWQAFLRGLDERIGPDAEEPRLEWAAQWIEQEHAPLEATAARLQQTLQLDVADRARKANLLNRLLLAAALLVSVGIAIWFYRRVLAPLAVAVDGFKQVANGDFAHRVPIVYDNEIGWLSGAFNHLSERLEALRRLLTGIEQGADLEGTLETLSDTLPVLLPVDWIGVLVIGVDGRLHLQASFSDGRAEGVATQSYEPDRTLLQECIQQHEPMHIPNLETVAKLSDSYVFLRWLVSLGRRDAVFLPIGSGATVLGVTVFANRYANSFRTEHLALLRNLGVLVGESLARTIRLEENTRLATIGQFASGIVHEIRNPLATIGLAFGHLETAEGLPDSARRRITIAAAELDRLDRLLDDILLYAKPLTLHRSVVQVDRLLRDTAAAQEIPGFTLQTAACPAIQADPDRLRQVFINLLRNARQASPAGAAIQAFCRPADGPWLEIEIVNAGKPIPKADLPRVFEPFFTSRHGGTGLGLPIVRRIVKAHGGEIELDSDEHRGTCARIRLPVAGVEESEVEETPQGTS